MVEVETGIEEILNAGAVPRWRDRIIEHGAFIAFKVGATTQAVGVIARSESNNLPRAALVEQFNVPVGDAVVGECGVKSTRII